jgi:hypothetical protein
MHVRYNELWRIEQDLATGTVAERLVATNRALMMYEPFLPPAPESSARPA